MTASHEILPGCFYTIILAVLMQKTHHAVIKLELKMTASHEILPDCFYTIVLSVLMQKTHHAVIKLKFTGFALKLIHNIYQII
jgi:hypothetical protein